jgi:hypothetical protein
MHPEQTSKVENDHPRMQSNQRKKNQAVSQSVLVNAALRNQPAVPNVYQWPKRNEFVFSSQKKFWVAENIFVSLNVPEAMLVI